MPTTQHTDDDAPVSVGFVSLGCAKNLVDSQVMAGHLLTHGIALAPSPEEADVVIVNTCSFIQDARDESTEAIRDVCRLKAEGGCNFVVVAGCMPQRYGEQMPALFQSVDAFVGVDDLADIPRIVKGLVSGAAPDVRVTSHPVRTFDPPVEGMVFTGGPYAYLKVAEGCNHACAFCAIPGIRGRHRSRPVASIVREAEALLGMGYRELDLISQDVTHYGSDLADGTDLAALLRALAATGGEFWLRLLYGYPSHVTDALLEVMAELPQVCPYLDVPIQHSHPEVLRAMRRGNTARSVMTLPARVRAAIPDAVLRTTCLVGFPGETEEHFQHLLEFIRASQFDHLGCFVFSPEENTPAYDMPDRLEPELAEERREVLMLAQQELVDRKLHSLVGQSARLLLERPADDNRHWVGRTARFAPEVDGDVRVRNVPGTSRPGDFVTIQYTKTDGYDMLAKAVSQER